MYFKSHKYYMAYLLNKSRYSFRTKRRFLEKPVISLSKPSSVKDLINRFALLKLMSNFFIISLLLIIGSENILIKGF